MRAKRKVYFDLFDPFNEKERPSSLLNQRDGNFIKAYDKVDFIYFYAKIIKSRHGYFIYFGESTKEYLMDVYSGSEGMTLRFNTLKRRWEVYSH